MRDLSGKDGGGGGGGGGGGSGGGGGLVMLGLGKLGMVGTRIHTHGGS